MGRVPKTDERLKESFAKESQTNRKFLAFAAKADQEGYPQVARFFRASAETSAVQAYNLLLTLKGVKGTRENLEETIGDETRKIEQALAETLRVAHEEGHRGAEAILIYASKVTQMHRDLCQKLLEGMGKPEENILYYVCPVCGYIAEENLPEKCPVCGARRELFKRIE